MRPLVIRCLIISSRVSNRNHSHNSIDQEEADDQCCYFSCSVMIKISTMNTLESDNDRHAAELAAKVSRLKNIAIDIDNDTKEHNRFLDSMKFDFDTARSFLGGSSRHLTNVMSSGKGDRRLMCYTIGAIVFACLFLYYVVNSFRRA